MKTILLVLIGSCLMVGCSRQATKSAESKYETLTLAWDKEIPDAGLTNHCVIIRTVTSLSTNVEQTDVDSLDQAGKVLGQYGWKLVDTATKDGVESWHMSRQVPADNKTFMLVIYNSKWNNKP